MGVGAWLIMCIGLDIYSRNWEVGSMGVVAGLYMYDVVVKKVHVRYLISWWALVLSHALQNAYYWVIAMSHYTELQSILHITH